AGTSQTNCNGLLASGVVSPNYSQPGTVSRTLQLLSMLTAQCQEYLTVTHLRTRAPSTSKPTILGSIEKTIDVNLFPETGCTAEVEVIREMLALFLTRGTNWHGTCNR